MAAYVLTEASARFLRGMMSDRRPPVAAAVSSRAVRPMAVQGDDYAAPYTIRWAESCGGWIIWLPDECLAVDGEAIDLTADLEAAGGDYPAGWYKLGIESDATSVYLNIYLPHGEEDEEPEEPSGEFAEEASGEDDTWPVLIASMDGRNVRQTVASALVLSGLGGVRWLNDMAGDLEILPDEDASIDIDGETYYVSVRRVADDGHILIGLTKDKPAEEGEGDAYCNDISHDAADDDQENAISDDGVGDEMEMGGGMGSRDGNVISRWPCKKNDEAGGNDL